MVYYHSIMLSSMTSKLLMLIAIGAVGSAAGVGSLDTVINAYVQTFGATPHTVFETPGKVHNVQIDWNFATTTGNDAYRYISECDLTFDKFVPAGSTVVCHVSGHDTNPTDGVLNPGPAIGSGQIVVVQDTRSVQVPILCTPPQGSEDQRCDVQDIEDVKVILVGKETTQVTLTEVGLCSDGKDNDFDGETDTLDPDCQ
jgi:hypothetical protein